jgi:RNA polymerase sigma-70 factor (ECF subfamily)
MGVPPDEMDLIRRAAADGDAFGELYTRYVRRIYSYIYYRTGDHNEAEDLTARVFQRALHHMGSYRDQGVPFSAWLYRIAHNLVANWHRDRSRRPIVPLDERLVASGASAQPERQELLILKFVDHLSNAEIGEIMGRSEGAIKSLYHRTLSSLRIELTGVDTSAVDSDEDEMSPQDGRLPGQAAGEGE